MEADVGSNLSNRKLPKTKALKGHKNVRLLSPNIIFPSIYHFMTLVSIVSKNFEFDKSGTKMRGYNSIIPLF